jgi:hypothetical protein
LSTRHKTQGTKEQRETTRNNKQNCVKEKKEGTKENYAIENDAKKNDAQ